MTGRLRAVWCRARGRHAIVALVAGEVVFVLCPRCRVGREVPLVSPVRPAAASELTVARAVEMGAVLIDKSTLAELTAAYLIESAFAGLSGETEL